MTMLKKMGLLDRECDVPYLPGTQLRVPLDWHWFWQYRDLTEYEPNTLRLFAATVVEVARGDAAFVDCGAHIGLVSHYMTHRCSSIKQVWAFEPNLRSFGILQENCARLPAHSQARNQAVSDFDGHARLVRAAESDGDDAYIEPDASGSIDVTTIDELHLAPHLGLVLKIDVEGSELAVLRGARRTLERAPFFAVLFEAHREVMKRTGYDPMECVRFLNALRACRWMPSSNPEMELALDRPFFSQIGSHIKRDIIVHTLPA